MHCISQLDDSAVHHRIIQCLYLVVFLWFLTSMVKIVSKIWKTGGTSTLVKVVHGGADLPEEGEAKTPGNTED